jgi:lipid-A-disaccharide synthase
MRIMISCGEASGDLYAGALARELRRRDASAEIFGFGGERLHAAGGSLVGNFAGLSVTGISEAWRVLPRSYAMFRRLVGVARERRPDVFVAIDFPDFNFRVMAAVARLGIPIVYYVSPQLWAWRPGRMETMKRLVERVLVIFPFEEALYRGEGVDVQFVGHPLVELVRTSDPRDAFLANLGLDPTAPTVALLPGSRPNELHRIVPDMAAAIPLIRDRVPRVQFVIACAPNLSDELFAPFAPRCEPAKAGAYGDEQSNAPAKAGGYDDYGRSADHARSNAAAEGGVPEKRVVHEKRVVGAGFSRPVLVRNRTDDVLATSDVVSTASGTATVQSALHERPMVVVYRLSPFTYTIGKPFVKVDTYAMANLVAGRRIVPELIQHELTPERIADETVSYLTDHERWTATRDALREVRIRLGPPGASGRAAEAILEVAMRRRDAGAEPA